MPKEQRSWIDNASYEQMLGRWRHANIGDPMFQGEAGEYYQKVMFAKRDALTPEQRVAASKAVGWNK